MPLRTLALSQMFTERSTSFAVISAQPRTTHRLEIARSSSSRQSPIISVKQVGNGCRLTFALILEQMIGEKIKSEKTLHVDNARSHSRQGVSQRPSPVIFLSLHTYVAACTGLTIADQNLPPKLPEYRSMDVRSIRLTLLTLDQTNFA